MEEHDKYKGRKGLLVFAFYPNAKCIRTHTGRFLFHKQTHPPFTKPASLHPNRPLLPLAILSPDAVP